MIIIPARLESTRLPRKLLLPLGKVPLIIKTAQNAQKFDETIVACDSNEILETCKKHNIKAILTSPLHSSGTDRCAEVAKKLSLPKDEIVINLQGDEPFLEGEIIKKLQATTKQTTFMASCFKHISKAQINDINLVKVVLNKENFALYFSRSVIPYDRDSSNVGDSSKRQDSSDLCDSSVKYYGHIGIYGFFAWSLEEFCQLEKSPLESIEKLEQLRALWHKKDILMCEVSTKSIGIDTQEDYQNAQKFLRD